jgi:hypothetical protein
VRHVTSVCLLLILAGDELWFTNTYQYHKSWFLNTKITVRCNPLSNNINFCFMLPIISNDQQHVHCILIHWLVLVMATTFACFCANAYNLFSKYWKVCMLYTCCSCYCVYCTCLKCMSGNVC